MTYKRSDVQLDYHGALRGRDDEERPPMVNIKARDFGPWSEMVPSLIQTAEAEGHGDAAAVTAWWLASDYVTDDQHGEKLQRHWQAAAEECWELFEDDAENIWGDGVKLHQEGRSGGYCVVTGLPPLDSWDAIMLGKWRRFERWCRACCTEQAVADRIAYSLMGEFEQSLIDAEAERDRLAALDADVTRWADLAGMVTA